MSLIVALLSLEADGVARDAFVDGVGALLRVRTLADFDGGGREIGTFTDHTRPTYDQVLALMDIAARDIDAEIGADTTELPRDARIVPLADSVLKLATARLIELSYFAGDVATGRSIYPQLDADYLRRLKSLVRAVGQAGAGDQPGAADDELLPVYAFPVVDQAPTRQEIIDRWIANGPYGLGY